MTEQSPAQALAAAMAAHAEAERANRAKSRFLAAASHDLRQPLQALRLLNAALQEYLLTDDMALNILRDSERALEVMDRLLGSLLDISKIDSGVIVPDLRDFRISDVFDDLRGEYSLLAREKNLEFVIVRSSRIVRSGRVLLDAILRNLLANAVRYTAKGKILLGCRLAGDCLRIEVHDTGSGIAQDQLENIFGEFYQIGSPDRDSRQGLGLGLAIVRGYARLLRSPVKVRSRPGCGSVFSIEVPLGNKVATVAARHEDRDAAPAGWDLRGCRALLIEDDAQALEALEKLLGVWGMQVLGARSGQEAAEKLAQGAFAPEIIISDYRLRGGETGIDAVNQVMKLGGESIPVIFVTGDSLGVVRAALGARFAHLLQKPVAPAKLRVLIRNLRKA